MSFLLHHLLSESAAEYPENTAVIFQDQSITYRELEHASNRLANVLAENGVRRGDRVGIYMPKTIQSIVSIFGILKAEAVYVPVAPDAPSKRVEYIIRNCGIACLLTAGAKLMQLANMDTSSLPLKTVISSAAVDADIPPKIRLMDWNIIDQSPDTHPPVTGAIDQDLAYILYTSGSTGDPKGVMISHLNSLTFVNWAQEFFEISPQDRIASYAPLHFDLSVFDIFAAVKAGASIFLIPDGAGNFPVRLAELIENRKVTIWNSVPSALVLLVTRGKLDRFSFSALRLVLFAGEIFPVKYLRQLKTLLPSAVFHNQYGQTEANSSTYYRVDSLPDDEGRIPIGVPAANFEVFALDEQGRPITREGEIGELYVCGSSVARGYWGDPEKTEKAFVENPLRKHAGSRVFRTGDLVTLDSEGRYIFLCRKDNMVKCRGYRIELGEIETVISSYSKVSRAAVVAVPDEVFGNRIKAFVVSARGKPLTDIEIKKHCLSSLPGYMVPDVIVVCSSLPVTSTGKVDKKSLVSSGAV